MKPFWLVLVDDLASLAAYRLLCGESLLPDGNDLFTHFGEVRGHAAALLTVGEQAFALPIGWGTYLAERHVIVAGTPAADVLHALSQRGCSVEVMTAEPGSSVLAQVARRRGMALPPGGQCVMADADDGLPALIAASLPDDAFARRAKSLRSTPIRPAGGNTLAVPGSMDELAALLDGTLTDGAHRDAWRAVLRLRCMDLAVRGGVTLPGAEDELLAALQALARGDVTVRVLRADVTEHEPELILLQADMDKRAGLADAALLWRAMQGADPRLPHEVMAVHTRGGTMAAVDYHGPSANRDMVAELLSEGVRASWGMARLALSGGPKRGCTFGATDILGTESAVIEAVADRLLANIMGLNRPILGWRTSFLVPLTLGDDDFSRIPFGKFAPLVPGKQEQAYFAQHCRDRLASGALPQQGEYLRSYEVPLPTSAVPWHLTIATGGEASTYLTLPIHALRLHALSNNALLVEWLVGGEDEQRLRGFDLTGTDADASDKHPAVETWAQILAVKGLDTCAGSLAGIAGAWATLGQVIEANFRARYLFSTFAEGLWGQEDSHSRVELRDANSITGVTERGHLVQSSPLEGYAGQLLKQALGTVSPAFFCDERALVFTSVVGACAPPDLENARKRFWHLRERLSLVEAAGTGAPYDPAYSAEELRECSYGRFVSMGSFYATTEHSFSFLGFGGFSRDVIHDGHTRTIYRRLFLIVQFHALILSSMTRDASRLEEASVAVLARKLSQAREALLRFTATVWFPAVTTQIQGRELFDLMRGRSTIDREFQLLTDQLDRAEAWVTGLARESEAAIERDQNALLYAVTALSLPLAVAWSLNESSSALVKAARDVCGKAAVAAELAVGIALFWSVYGVAHLLRKRARAQSGAAPDRRSIYKRGGRVSLFLTIHVAMLVVLGGLAGILHHNPVENDNLLKYISIFTVRPQMAAESVRPSHTMWKHLILPFLDQDVASR